LNDMCKFVVVAGSFFLPRDAYTPHTHCVVCAMARCLFATSRSSIETAEWIEPVFGALEVLRRCAI